MKIKLAELWPIALGPSLPTLCDSGEIGMKDVMIVRAGEITRSNMVKSKN